MPVLLLKVAGIPIRTVAFASLVLPSCVYSYGCAFCICVLLGIDFALVLIPESCAQLYIHLLVTNLMNMIALWHLILV